MPALNVDDTTDSLKVTDLNTLHRPGTLANWMILIGDYDFVSPTQLG